jgi:hypothetical protein
MPGWQAVGASVQGTSHAESGLPCQDHHAFAQLEVSGGLVFVAAVADGAGSAPRSDEGAQLVCEQFLVEIKEVLDGLDSVHDFGPDQLAACWATTRMTLVDHAMTEEAEFADFASTFLTVVVLPDRVLAAQLGDGAIVLRQDGAYRVAIWPQQGEFANTTNFLTGEGWEEKREMVDLSSKCDAVVMFTDGLQQLVLRYATRDPEGRFVEPLVAAVGGSETREYLEVSLCDFLSSSRVNSRTDDDKTLLVARLLE